MVTRIDAHFGNILAALEEQGVAENTLVIFQSDNGGPNGRSNAVFDANGGLRGHKGSIYEGGIRVPWVMRWPAVIHQRSRLRAGSHSDHVVDASDLLPTFCELAGTPAPVGVDGVSIAPSLVGDGDQRRREFIIHEAWDGQSIIRGNDKLVRTGESSLALYDLEADPAEERNLAEQRPELVRELQRLLLGERVDEPAGFANTYHRWIGGDGGVTSRSEHWSDYVYANAGVTYVSDRGAPQVSWIARMENVGEQPAAARGDADLEFLGLEILGRTAEQRLELEHGVQLTGRNEIRISKHGHLKINGGTVSSLRWVDLQPGGTLSGNGTIDADLYAHGTLIVTVGDNNEVPWQVRGEVKLAGPLAVTREAHHRLRPGDRFTILLADRVTGSFDNPTQQVVAEDGTRFSIEYTDNAVTLTVQKR